MTDFEADTCWCELSASFSLTDAFLSPAWSDVSFFFSRPSGTSADLTWICRRAGEVPTACGAFTGSALPPTCVCHVLASNSVCCVTTDEKFLVMHLQRSNNTTPWLSSALILTGGVGGGEADVPACRQSAEVMCCHTTSRQTVWLQPGLFIYSLRIRWMINSYPK